MVWMELKTGVGTLPSSGRVCSADVLWWLEFSDSLSSLSLSAEFVQMMTAK